MIETSFFERDSVNFSVRRGLPALQSFAHFKDRERKLFISVVVGNERRRSVVAVLYTSEWADGLDLLNERRLLISPIVLTRKRDA